MARRAKAIGMAVLLAVASGCGAEAKPAEAPSGMYGGAAAAPAADGMVSRAETPPAQLAMAPPPAPPGSQGSPAAPPTVADVPHGAAMLIYTANLTLAVYQVEPQLDAVERIGRDLGGYLSLRQDNAITIRVPRDRFDEAVARVEKLGDVTHRDIRAQDVTDQYVDLDARLKNAYAMRDRLQQLLEKADVKNALEIEKELGRVTEDIERMEGKLKLLRDQIAYSTITATFAALSPQTVHDTSLLAPFPWLQQLGLQPLLDVHP